jgi:hypothetical protein
MSNDSTPPISPKVSLDIQDDENDIKPDMSNYNYDNIIKDINLYSIYLNKNFNNKYLNKKNWYIKILKKFKLSPTNTKKRYDKHLKILLTILFLISNLKFTKKFKFEHINFLIEYLNYLKEIVSFLEEDAITNIYHYYDHSDRYTYIDINNIDYFIIAKNYLGTIYKKTKILYKDFYDKKYIESSTRNKYNIYYLSNTHINGLLNLIIENEKLKII